jgi:hypothetical protein
MCWHCRVAAIWCGLCLPPVHVPDVCWCSWLCTCNMVLFSVAPGVNQNRKGSSSISLLKPSAKRG